MRRYLYAPGMHLGQSRTFSAFVMANWWVQGIETTALVEDVAVCWPLCISSELRGLSCDFLTVALQCAQVEVVSDTLP